MSDHREELVEIAAQLGYVNTEHATAEELRKAIREAGVSDAEIDAEIAEQQGRETPGRPT